jgi:hypothetical protein
LLEKHSLEQAVAALGRGGPILVVVVSGDYALLLDNWMAHINALGISRFLVVAMDYAIENHLSGRGIITARAHFDGSASDFWLRRMLIWQYLTKLGVDFVQSDIDAIWLKDPIPEFFTGQSHDLLCSQGTLHPADAASSWGFVLCTGLMGIRSGPAAIRFFDAFQDRADQILATDDQEVMNHLLGENDLIWDMAGAEPEINHLDGIPFDSYPSIITGTSAALGVTIGLLPLSLFPRLPTSANGSYVKHLLRPEDDTLRIPELKAQGCWLIDG